jgi:NAD(P)-dependent dehydrogenase (short-subunit alcohol dehydrogenase family)
MPKSSKRVALVTGGSRGIGRGIAEKLAESGFDLAINGVRPAVDAGDAIKALEKLGAAVVYCQGDVSVPADRQSMLDGVRQRFGRLDALVNNAGVVPSPRADVLEATEESFDRVLSINLKGPYFLTQLAARWMIEQRKADGAFGGVIVNISSVSASEASINRGDYCISKAGIAMATMLWAARLAEFGIDVYEVRPGIISTDMTSGVREKYDALIAGGLTLDKRWGTPLDVGRAVTALAKGDIPYATGQVIHIDGGMTIQRL